MHPTPDVNDMLLTCHIYTLLRGYVFVHSLVCKSFNWILSAMFKIFVLKINVKCCSSVRKVLCCLLGLLGQIVGTDIYSYKWLVLIWVVILFSCMYNSSHPLIDVLTKLSCFKWCYWNSVRTACSFIFDKMFSSYTLLFHELLQ